MPRPMFRGREIKVEPVGPAPWLAATLKGGDDTDTECGIGLTEDEAIERLLSALADREIAGVPVERGMAEVVV